VIFSIATIAVISALFLLLYPALKTLSFAKIKDSCNSWKSTYYPGHKKWIFFTAIVSYPILFITGFLFSALGFLRLQGIPLLIHVSIGGLFSASTALILLIRAGDYPVDRLTSFSGFKSPSSKKTFFFWVLIFSVFILTLTALTMMLPFISLDGIRTAFILHRYFALLSLISASFLIIFTQADRNSP